MLIALLGKTVCELSLYCVAAGFLTGLFDLSNPMYPAPACAAVAICLCCLVRGSGSRLVRLLPLLLLPLAFLTAKHAADFIFAAPLCLYAAVTAVKGAFFTAHGRFLSFFKRGFFAGVAFTAFALLLPVQVKATELELPFLFIFLLTGVLTLRMLRQEPSVTASRGFVLLNALSLAAAVSGAFLFSSPAALSLASLLWNLLITYAVAPVVKFFVYIFSLLTALLMLLFGISPGEQSMFTEHGIASEAADTAEELVQAETVGEAARALPAWFVIAFVCALFALAAFLFFRKLLGSRPLRRFSANSVNTSALSPARGEITSAKVSFAGSRSSREAVRHCYRKFLLLCGRRGIHVRPSSTSESVAADASARFDTQPLDELREAYIAARYDPGTPVSADDVRAARAALKKLRSDE